MKRLRASFILILLFLLPITVYAQSSGEELSLTLTRDFGYGGFTGDIQGTFSMKVSGPDSLASVEFFIDDQRIGTDEEPPFRLQFSTDNFEPGQHTLHAIGYTSDGRQLSSNRITRTFLSPEDAGGLVTRILVPLLVVVLAFSLIGAVGPLLFRRDGKSFKLGEYNKVAGGAICPRCELPYSRHAFSPNLTFLGKLERCPHCGKIALVRRASPDELKLAEARFRQAEEPAAFKREESEEERLRRQLDQSRFED